MICLHDIMIDEAGPKALLSQVLKAILFVDVELRNIRIRHHGGQSVTPAPDDEKSWNIESTMWGILLPGFSGLIIHAT